MRNILYHNSSGTEAYAHSLSHPEIRRAITLHPVKNYRNLYRLHYYMQHLKIRGLESQLVSLIRSLGELHELYDLDLPKMDNPEEGVFLSHLAVPAGLHPLGGPATDELSAEAYSLVNKLMFSLETVNPRYRIPQHINKSVYEVISHAVEDINGVKSREKGRDIGFKSLYYGYVRQSPGIGVQMVLDMLLLYQKFRGNKMTLPVRRHAYIQVPYASLYVRKSREQTVDFDYLQPDVKVVKKTVNFLLPLSGRYGTFQRFMGKFRPHSFGSMLCHENM